jgi:N-acetylmuramoyl-L-alanine amidase
MKIENNLLTDDPRIQPYVPAPRGWLSSITINPEFLVEHYTATISLADAFASAYFAHIYIDELGLIYQKVPLDKWAAHAGTSEWGGRKDLNKFSHGIEHINYGWVYKNWSNGKFGRSYVINDKTYWTYVPNDRVIDSPHRLEKAKRYFETYTEKQLESSWDVTKCLNDNYHYIDIVGHEDVCAKVDPGPAYPLKEFKNRVYGNEVGKLFTINRWWAGSGIGTGGMSLKWLPYSWSVSKVWCPVNTIVRKLEWSGRWVKVLREDNGKDGWIEEKYLRRML